MSCLVIILSVLSLSQLKGQERYFTQFYAAPVVLNPALTGNFNGNYRINLAYRNQWSNNLENPFSSFAGSIDLNFNLAKKMSRVYDQASAGIFFATDKAGILSYGNTEMGLAGAYHKALGPGQNLSGGLYISLNQRNINFTNVTFEDQFNGEDGYTATTAENLPESNFAFFDSGIGLHYSNYQNKQNGFDIGAALGHYTQPEISFYKKDPAALPSIASFKLPLKYTLHLGGRIISTDYTSIFPRLMYQRQGVQDMVTAGANVKMDVNVFSIHLGAFGRGAGVRNKYNFDSVGILTGIEYNNWLVGVSYDSAVPNIINYSRNQGTVEVTLSYFGFYENDDLMCPTF